MGPLTGLPAVQLAPMGGVSVSARLPVAVALAGGHAVYPALAMPAEALGRVLDELAAQTRAFGVNFLVPLMREDALDAALARAPYVDFFLAEPDAALVARVHAAGARCGWQVESPEEAAAAEAAGCDVVIAKGAESGGRKRFEGPPLLELLAAIGVSIPVIAAGGIATREDASAARAAGAAAVRVGTRFIAAEESEAHPVWIEAILRATAVDSVVSHAFNAGMPVPGPHRVLRSSIEAAEALDPGDPSRFAPFPPSAATTGPVGAMPFYAGTSAGAVIRREPAAAIVADLAPG